MRRIDLIVIHCSATPNGRPHTAADIDAWHKARGFTGIGYHKVIYVDGSVHDGRRIEQIGAHASGYNAYSIGICMIGTDKFTLRQWESLKSLVDELQDKYAVDSAYIAGHRDLPDVHKSCPGFSVAEWKANGRLALDDHIFKDKEKKLS